MFTIQAFSGIIYNKISFRRGVKIVSKVLKSLLEEISPNNQSIKHIAKYLGYSLGSNPVNEESEWKILFTDKTDDYSKGVIAIKPVEGMDVDSSTREIRRLFKDAEQLKTDLSLSFEVQIVAFVGEKRIIFFPYLNGNRDIRLDINPKTSEIPLYQDNFNLLSNESVIVEEDEFGFGDDKIVLNIQEIFKRELTSHFRQTTNFYRKKLSEVITATELKERMGTLFDSKAKTYLEKKDLINLVSERSYTSALSTVVDTIILRQLMRRFLEGYYGSHSFEVSGIALGVGDGTLDDAISRSVIATQKETEEKDIISVNRKKKPIKEKLGQLNLFDLYDEDEQNVTSDIEEFSKEETDKFSELIKKAREQFETVFEGDLFAGSVGKVANEIEEHLSSILPEFLAQMWVDTSSNRYSFRYEDLPPAAIEEHYENSMSQNIQINFEEDEPVVLYGSTEAEQKSKGAYYTNHQFVDYMISQSVEVKFDDLISELNTVVKNKGNIKEVLDRVLNFKVADLTCGGGSFLRGAFLKLASKHPTLSNIRFPEEILEKYPMLQQGPEGEAQWESYVLHNMIYGVDFDYKAILITSLTLSLTTIEHRENSEELPSLIGKNLIHQNSLINSVPFNNRKEIYANYRKEIKELRYSKIKNKENFESLRKNLQAKIRQKDYAGVTDIAEFLHVEALEINLPEIFFDEEGIFNEIAGFDCVIGNPPWDKNKPNSDEFYSEFDPDFPRSSTRRVKNQRKNELQNTMPFLIDKWKQYEKEIKAANKYYKNSDNFDYQTYLLNGRKTGGDTNLYVIAVERFTQLLKENGYFSVLIPDNFATDENTTGIRHMVFDDYAIKEFLSFENRQGIFPAVHRSYKFAVLTFKKMKDYNDYFDAFFYRQHPDDLMNSDMKFSYPIKLVVSDDDYTLIEVNNSVELNIIIKLNGHFSKLKTISNFEIGRDFDKSLDSNHFKPLTDANIPLYEGKLMNQFSIFEKKLTEGIPEKVVKKKLGHNYKEYRIAIRTIARATDKRSLIATILPKQSVATNSLHVQRNVDLMSLEERLYYLGLFNSYIIDFYLRNLVTININKRYLAKLPVAKYNNVSSNIKIQSIVKSLLLMNGDLYNDLKSVPSIKIYENMSRENLVAHLNAIVFKEYKLTREEVIMIMRTFESSKYRNEVIDEAQRIIDVFDTL